MENLILNLGSELGSEQGLAPVREPSTLGKEIPIQSKSGLLLHINFPIDANIDRYQIYRSVPA